MAHETEVQEWFTPDMAGALIYPQHPDMIGKVGILPGQCQNAHCPTKCAHGTLIILCQGGSMSLRFDPYQLELLAQEMLSVAKMQQVVIGQPIPSWPKKDI